MAEAEPYSYIGQAIRALREERGWTQLDLAAKVGVAGPYISALEAGKKGYTNPNLDSISRFATAFNLRPGDLILMLNSKEPA